MPARIQFALGLVWISLTTSVFAAPPVITGVVPRGLKPGVNEVAVQGGNFTPQMQALLDIPGAAVIVKAGVAPSANQIVWTVTLPGETPVGLYEMRVATTDGLSAPAQITVDAFATLAEVEPNELPSNAQGVTLPMAMEGRLNGVESDLFAFDGQAGQRFVAEIAARRLGANVKPVLRLSGPDRLQLQSARPQRSLGDDARLEVVLPKAGRYILQVQDLLYRGDNNQYRLFLGDIPARTALPLGGRPEDMPPPGALLFGDRTNTGPQLAAGLAPEQRGVLAVSGPGAIGLPLPKPYSVNDNAAAVEVPRTDGKPQTVTPGTTITGRIDSASEIDTYSVPVTAGQKLRIAVEADRLGGALDAVVEVRNDQGAVLLTQDDGLGTADPDFVYAVPANLASLTIAVRDVHRRSGPSYGYRLLIEPAPEGDFDLRMEPSVVNVPAGGTAILRVRAIRRECAGAIRLALAGDLPAGLIVTGAEIGPGATETLLSLSLPEKAEPKSGVVRLYGQIGPPEKPVLVRIATGPPTPAHQALPWLQNRLGVGTAPGLPISLLVEGDAPLLRGVEHNVKVRVRRAADQTGPVRLTLLTTQVPPGQGQPALVANQMIPENAAEAIVKITVPQNCPEFPFGYSLTGELLDAKTKQTVVAKAESACVATRIAFPFQVELAIPPELARGTRYLLAGKLTRIAPFNEPVEITLPNLPGNFRTLTVTVPANATDFNVPLLIPPTQAPGPVANVQLVGAWMTNPPLPSAPRALAVAIAKTDPPNSLEIFSDGLDFPKALTDGPGMVSLDETNIYSGKQSALVTGGPKTKAGLPGLGVQIVENPAPGQYRFIRFAWKKKGGASIALQLANNGALGGNNTKGTEFRYVAGQDAGKPVKTADAIPVEWTVVTRDLFTDHGPFTLTGVGLVPVDGEAAWFDHVYLGRTEADLPGK